MGWSFIDPMADLPADRSHFIDSSHLTSVGAAKVGASVANAMIPLIRSKGMPVWALDRLRELPVKDPYRFEFGHSST